MRRSLAGAAGVAAALVGLVVLAGCGSDPKAEPSPSPSTPSVSTTPSPTAPVMPAAASENSKAGAIAFVRYYIELINHAQATGDVAPLAAVEDAGCKSCTRGRNAIEAIYNAGGEILGGDFTIRVTSSVRSPRYRGWLVTAALQFAPETVSRSKGSEPETLSGGSTPVNAFVSNSNAEREWRVMEWTRGS